MEGTPTCPRCGQDTMVSPKVRNALSRMDNATYVCDPCGNDEAMRDYFGTNVWPGFPGPMKRMAR